MQSLVEIGSEMWICIRDKQTNLQTNIQLYIQLTMLYTVQALVLHVNNIYCELKINVISNVK